MEQDAILTVLEKRLLSLSKAAFKVLAGYGHIDHTMLMHYHELFVGQVMLAARLFLPPERWRQSIARDVLSVDLTVFEHCNVHALDYALSLVGEHGVRCLVVEHNERNGPNDRFVLFRVHCLYPDSPLNGRLFLMTERKRARFESALAQRDADYLQRLLTRRLLQLDADGVIYPHELN